MMTAREAYEQWAASPALSPEERAELLSIAGDPGEIESRFYAPLEFGTAGLRGVMATGLHNMNRHIVRHTTRAFANLVLSEGREAAERGVAVCHDCRHRSREFALEAACVLAAAGVRVRLFEDMRPTPELSFAIREYGCTAGVNITASHNPKEYNGYKVYWSDGAQLPPRHADIVSAERERLDMFRNIPLMDYDEAVRTGLITLMGAPTDESFLDKALRQSVCRDAVAAVADDFKIVYTPFHGTGRLLVPEALRRLGLRHILCVPEQMVPDGSFPTVKSPNPEEEAGFRLAVELARREGADLIIGTDPDADRVGVLARGGGGNYVMLSGNQVGVLLLDYLITARRQAGTLPANAALIKTVVTTEMARAVAERNGVACLDTFTGFKFMAEKIKETEESGSHRYILAYEESYGYLAGDHARDKDAVTASLLIAEMAAWHKTRGRTLHDALEDLFETYGRYAESTLNLVMPGLDGLARMRALMERLRDRPPSDIGGTPVTAVRDYLRGERRELPGGAVTALDPRGSDVLYFELAGGTRFIVRPSGTEPKIKVYVMVRENDAASCAQKVRAYESYALSLQG